MRLPDYVDLRGYKVIDWVFDAREDRTFEVGLVNRRGHQIRVSLDVLRRELEEMQSMCERIPNSGKKYCQCIADRIRIIHAGEKIHSEPFPTFRQHEPPYDKFNILTGAFSEYDPQVLLGSR